MRAAATMLFGLWLSMQARAEDGDCERLAASSGLTGSEKASFVERCLKSQQQSKPAPGNEDKGKDVRSRSDRGVTRDRSDRDDAAAPLLRPGR